MRVNRRITNTVVAFAVVVTGGSAVAGPILDGPECDMHWTIPTDVIPGGPGGIELPVTCDGRGPGDMHW